MDIDEQLEKDLMRSFGRELVQTHDFKDKLGTQWYNRAAALLANRMAEMTVPPEEIVKEHKGYARWSNIEPMFNPKCEHKYGYLIVEDKLNHIHFTPVVHMDTCTMSMNITLNEELSQNIHKVSDSLRYHNGKLSASSDFPGGCVAQFAVVKRINNGKLTLGDARDVYKVWIQLVYEEWLEIVQGKKIDKALLSAVLERYILN